MDIVAPIVNFVALLVSAWIEIRPEDSQFTKYDVALLVSAWIEIVSAYKNKAYFKSHSS